MAIELTNAMVRAQSPKPSTQIDVAFCHGNEFTVGAEEELFLLDASNGLSPDAGNVLVPILSAQVPKFGGSVSAELFAAQIEFATTVCADAGQIMGQLSALRLALAEANGRFLAAGLHPDAAFADAALSPTARYDFIGEGLAGLLRTPTAAFQVHVGLPDGDAGVLAYRGIRHWLAMLQALAANSPFWHGQDSGLASARWAVINSYPRSGVPPTIRSWDEYVALISAVQEAAEVPDYTHVWWDARLQPRLGTIEVRVMDSQPRLEVAAGLAALVQGLVAHAVTNPVAIDLPSSVLAENSFRVARHGLETRIVDLDGSLTPVRELACRGIAQARAILRSGGADGPLCAVERLVAEETECARQRRLHAETGMTGLLGDLVERTLRG